MTQVHARERKSCALIETACQESVFGRKSSGTFPLIFGVAREQRSIVETRCGSMMCSGVALECAPTRNSTAEMLQCSTMVALVAARPAMKPVQLVPALRTGVSILERVGIPVTRVKILRSGAHTRNGARTCWSAVQGCATPQPMKTQMVLVC